MRKFVNELAAHFGAAFLIFYQNVGFFDASSIE